jgi:P-type Ca2+ transporter type 2B
MQKLGTSNSGISAKDTAKRIQVFGSNRPVERKVKTLLEYILENFEDEMLKVLCLAAAVALVVGIINEGWKEVLLLISEGLA